MGRLVELDRRSFDHHMTVFDAAVKQIHVAEKLVHERRGGMMIDLGGGADLFDPALIHHDYAIREFESFFLIMGDEDAGDVEFVVKLAQPASQLGANLGIQRAERLVEQQHTGLDRERARQCDSLSLSARELRGQPIRHRIELHQLQQFVHATCECRSSDRTRARGLTRKPKATFSNTLIWRNNA